MRRFKSISLAISVVLLSLVCSAQQRGHKVITEYRPTLSNSALLLPSDISPAVGNARHFSDRPAGSLPVLRMPSSPDNWNGGTGNWSVPGNWSAGAPGVGSDVTIYSGGNDTVTLDVGSTTINSLTLGGSLNGSRSELTDGGAPQMLTINNALTIGDTGSLSLTGGSTVTVIGTLVNSTQGGLFLEHGSALTVNGDVTNSGFIGEINGGGPADITIYGKLTSSGYFYLTTPGDVANVGTLANSGTIFLEPGTTLNLTKQPNGVTDVVLGSEYIIFGTFTAGGNNPFANLTSVEGLLQLSNQQTTNVAPSGGVLTNTGKVEVTLGSALFINGNVNNLGGALLYIDRDSLAGMPSLNNSGTVSVIGALNLTNQPNGVTDVVAGSEYGIVGSFTAGANNAFANLTSVEGLLQLSNQQTTNVAPSGGVLTNSGTIGLGNTTTLNVAGDINNSGTIVTGPCCDSGNKLSVTGNLTNSGTLELGDTGDTVTVNGMLTNEPTGQINLNGPGDVLQALGGLTNSGLIAANNGSSIDPPFVNNLGTINIDSLSKFVVGTGTPSGLGYIQLANGTLGEMISATNFGVINVSGSALLDGTLAILPQGGFNPSVGSTYKFLNFTPGELSGIFADIENDIFNNGTEKWFVDYENGGGYVELIAEPNGGPVPEPATLLVLIPGLVGLGYGLRRKLLS
jgi:hypothetical protein